MYFMLQPGVLWVQPNPRPSVNKHTVTLICCLLVVSKLSTPPGQTDIVYTRGSQSLTLWVIVGLQETLPLPHLPTLRTHAHTNVTFSFIYKNNEINGIQHQYKKLLIPSLLLPAVFPLLHQKVFPTLWSRPGRYVLSAFFVVYSPNLKLSVALQWRQISHFENLWYKPVSFVTC